MNPRQRRAVRLTLAQDDGSSNIELVEYLVRDVGLALDEAWQLVRGRHLRPLPPAMTTPAEQRL